VWWAAQFAHWHFINGRYADSTEVMTEARAVAERYGLENHLFDIDHQEAAALVNKGDHAAAKVRLDVMERRLSPHQRMLWPYYLHLRSVFEQRLGHGKAAADHAERALAMARVAGVPVLVCADRHLAGRLAEKRFAATVMLLDDGFQHLALGRNVDVLVMPASDLDDAVLPSGRLREPLDAASSADCVLVPGSLEDVSRVAATFDRMPVFRVTNHFGTVQGLDASAPSGTRVVAVAGIARPERFFTTLREQGFEIVRELRFPDHHWFSSDDLDRIRTIAKDASADFVATTEKDAVRVAPQSGWAVLPMTAVIEPPELFSSWLRERL